MIWEDIVGHFTHAKPFAYEGTAMWLWQRLPSPFERKKPLELGFSKGLSEFLLSHRGERLN